MRNSRILKKLREGKIARIACEGHPIPMFPRHAANAGYDGVWLEAEHNTWTVREIETAILYHHLADIDCIVRPSTREKVNLYHYLEMGATGLMIPHVNTPAEAHAIVNSTKFPPAGERGLDGSGIDGGFYINVPSDYTERANNETLVVLQIETPEAVKNVDDIAAIKGVDVLFIGPGDLSHRLDIKINMKDPKFLEAQQKVADAAAKYGIHWGRPAYGEEDLANVSEAGARFIAYGGDFVAIMQSLKKWGSQLDEYERATEQKSSGLTPSLAS